MARHFLFWSLLSLLPAAGPAAENSSEGPALSEVPAPTPRESTTIFPKREQVTQHEVRIGDETIAYTATAGMMTLRDAEEAPTAEIFYIAYTRDGVEDRAARPVTFSFNGGPGSSSVWMHLGLLGPKRVVLEDDGSPVAPPYRLVDNAHSLLDVTDLVFIDPVSTGFSRARDPEKAKTFHSVEGDTRSVADFIRLYATRNERWTSPKFLIGESYGTTRAADLAGHLAQRHFLNLNGLMLVSTVLDFQTIAFTPGNDLPYVLFLPSYTATAWYHQKLPPELQELPLPEVVARAEAFASDAYLRALFQGDRLSAEQHAAVRRKLARFTGLDEATLEQMNLRPRMARYAVELLRDEGLTVGRFDSRYTGHLRNRDASQMPFDPSAEAIFSPYASTFHDYIRGELGVETDRVYEILTSNVRPWDWGAENQYLNVAGTLAEILTQQPFLKVHVSNGYYDLATPYFATNYTLDHLNLPASARERIVVDTFHAGHMMYVNLPDLERQKTALARFIQEASGTP